jgi:uncharacterized membrane protein YfcA
VDSVLNLALLVLAAGLAGWVDAIVGGGGLIQLPALFSAYPQAAPATLMGTNKGAAIWGTAWAASQYARRVRLRWAALWPAVAAAFVGAGCGAWLVTRLPARPLRVALPVVLLALLLYTLARKDLGRRHAPRFAGRAEAAWFSLIGGLIGLYDGAFGPGTGSFFVFAGVRGLGYDFLHASAHAKLLNAATNLAALGWFISQGNGWWQLALPMALANVAGSWLGTRAALRHGTGFVRGVFVAVVGALIVKTSWDAAGLLGWR